MTSRFALVVMLVACGGGSKPATTPSNNAEPAPPSTTPVAAPISNDALGDHRRAIADVDDANPRSVDRAIKAADALGEARHAAAIGELASLALRPPSKKLAALQVAAIRALGRMTTDKPHAIEALAKVIARDPARRPRDKEEETAYALYLSSVGAAVNAVGELDEPRAAATLVPVMYRTPELMMQVRRALAASGSVAAAEMRKIIRGEHAGVNALLKDNKLDVYCSPTDSNMCGALGNRDFYAAIVLGDLHDASAVGDLLAALDRPALPPYYVDDAPAPNTQHTAIFDALRKIGAPGAAPKLRTLWTNRSTPLEDRIGAIGAYAFCARDAAAADELWKIAADNTADDGLRVEAATAYARVAKDKARIAVFGQIAKKYTDAAAKKRAAADKRVPAKQKADIELDKAKDGFQTARTKLIAVTQDQSSTVDQIKAATETAKRSEADFKAAKAKHRTQTAEWTQNDTAAKAYVGYARMFQTHVARVDLAVRCAEAVDCYAQAIATTPSDAVAHVKPFVADVDKWTDDEKQGLVDATVDRAMLELGKRAATAKLDVVLDALTSENRLVREAILIALPKLAPSPCPACITKLDAAIEAGRTKPYLGPVQIETQITRNYLESR